VSGDHRDWRTDWPTFIETIAADYRRGLSDKEVSKNYEGERVTWTGVVQEKRLDVEFPGILFHMPPLKVQVGNGRWTMVDSKLVPIAKSSIGRWQNVSIGATVRFSTGIEKTFVSAIRWSDSGGKKGWFTILLEDAEIEEVISENPSATSPRKAK
jgi:hypothetical protein